QVSAGEKESTIRLELSSPVNAGVASTYVKVEPEVKTRLSVDRNTLFLTGPLRPGQSYKIRVAKGLPAIDDAVLKEEWSSDVNIRAEQNVRVTTPLQLDKLIKEQEPGLYRVVASPLAGAAAASGGGGDDEEGGDEGDDEGGGGYRGGYNGQAEQRLLLLTDL